jgi:hypothetical protein
MKTLAPRLMAFCLCYLSLRATATTYYVDINSPSPTPPYTSWSTAATNIQDAVNQTTNGDLVFVNPGVYRPVKVTNAISIQGVAGPAATTIDGNNALQCISLAKIGATLTGFTLTHGNNSGVFCGSTAGIVISNCAIVANTAPLAGGGAYQGTLVNCTISQNFVTNYNAYGGGGAYDAVLINCIVISNSIYAGNGCGVNNCNVTNSLIADNYAILVNDNITTYDGGGAYEGNLDHCNIVGNSATSGGGTYNANMVDCIDYFNTASTTYGQAGSSNYLSGTISYTCTAPEYFSAANITNDPKLASPSHISLTSPCRGAGLASGSFGVDIDGNPWASPPSMGCFEPSPGSALGNLTVAISTPFTNWAPGYPLSLQANISGPVYSNVWNLGDGIVITNEAYVSHAWSATGTYPVTLTAYNDSYPTGVTATLPITIAVPSVFYVNLNSRSPVPPYINWAAAAINIQDAVNVATPGSLVLVTNGPTYTFGLNSYLSNTAAWYMGGGTNAPDGNFYRVVITNAITVESVNGPTTTYIWGWTPSSSDTRSVYLTNGATLNGFTLTNYSDNSQIWQISATSTNALITNCILTEYVTVNSGTFNNCSLAQSSSCNNSALNNCSLVGSSSAINSILNNCVISNNSGVLGGVLNDCLLVNNTNSGNIFGVDGGAAAAEPGYPLVLNNCLISNNATTGLSGSGGGVYNFPSDPYTNCILNNCVLSRNFANGGGGGAYAAELNNCQIVNNTSGSGGGAGGVQDGLLINCTLIGNSNAAAGDAVLSNCDLIANVDEISGNAGAANDCTLYQCRLSQNVGRSGGAASDSILNNCLIVSNLTRLNGNGGGVYYCQLTNCILADNVATNGGGAYEGTLANCTVIANTAVKGGGVYQTTADNCVLYYNSGGDFYPSSASYPLNFCCASLPVTNGIRNITAPPLFVNLAGGDYHLQSSSPCINSGNNAYVGAAAADLDGNPRIVGGTVDIGAFEYQVPTSVISYAYLQQYGLPIDGSVDFADLDGIGFNVYQDWIAGLNPTNPTSVLAMLTPVTTNTANGVTVTWQSVSGVLYFIQRSTNLAAQPPFSMIQNNITGQTNTTSYVDTSATNSLPYFYRVGVTAP